MNYRFRYTSTRIMVSVSLLAGLIKTNADSNGIQTSTGQCSTENEIPPRGRYSHSQSGNRLDNLGGWSKWKAVTSVSRLPSEGDVEYVAPACDSTGKWLPPVIKVTKTVQKSADDLEFRTYVIEYVYDPPMGYNCEKYSDVFVPASEQTRIKDVQDLMPGSVYAPTPEMKNAGAESGCVSCSATNTAMPSPGSFGIHISLGTEVAILGGNPAGENSLSFLSSLQEASSLRLSNFDIANKKELLQIYDTNGIMVSQLAPGSFTVRNFDGSTRVSLEVTTEAGVGGNLSSILLKVTPSDATTASTTHDFKQVTDDQGYTGLKYTRTKNGASESISYLQWGGATIINNVLSGDFKYIAPNGDVTQWTPMPAVAGLVIETTVMRPAAAGELEITEVTSSIEIGLDLTRSWDLSKRKRVKTSETITKRRGSFVDTETIDRAFYDKYYWPNNNGTPNTNNSDSRYGREKWSRSSKGGWSMTSYVMASSNNNSPFQFEHRFAPWKDAAALPVTLPAEFLTSSTSAATFFAALQSHAVAQSYNVPGTVRTTIQINRDDSPAWQRNNSSAWHEKVSHFIGDVQTGEEYTFDQAGSPDFALVPGWGGVTITHKTRTERVDRLARMAWNATFARDDTTGTLARRVHLDQLGIATITTTLLKVNGEDIVDTWRTLVTSTASTSRAERALRTYSASTRHPLWSKSTDNAIGQTIQNQSFFGLTGTNSDTLIQTIDTSYAGETRYTRTSGSQTLDSQAEDTTTTENSIKVRTSTRTDAQGITTITKTNEATGEMISETRQGVAATAEFPAQPPLTTLYAKTTNTTTGDVTQTVTQDPGTPSSTADDRTLSVTVTDALGRTKSVTDDIGHVTTYDYSADGRTTTETLPGNLTRITTTYLDGQLKSVSGTAVVPEFHDYTVNDGTNANYEAGSITETVWTGWNGTGTAPPAAFWRKTTTNFLGWVLREEQLSPAETGGAIATVHTYNAKGQRTKSQTTGQAVMLFTYDDWGNPLRQGYDLNEDGSLTPTSADQVIEQTRTYTATGDRVFDVTTESVLGLAGSTATSSRDLKEEGGTWQERTAGNGRSLINKTEDDALSHMRWEGSGETLNENWKTGARTFYNGLLMSEMQQGKKSRYQYDGFGRVTQVVAQTLEEPTINNPRQTTTTTFGYTAGLLTSESFSGNGTRTFTRDARTYTHYPVGHVNAGMIKTVTEGSHVTRYAYDIMGRQTYLWGDAVQPQRYEYDTLGRLWKLHTYQSGTGWNSETLPAAFTTATSATTTWTYRPGTNTLWKKTDALNRSVTYTYDASGLLLTKTNARGTTATYSYAQTPSGKKIPGRVSGISYNDGITPPVSFTYHADGSLKTATDAAGTQGINLSASSVLARNLVISGDGLLNGVILNRTHLDEDTPQTLQLQIAGAPIMPDTGGSLSYNSPAPVLSRVFGWASTTLFSISDTYHGGLTQQPATNVTYNYLNGRVRHRYANGLAYQASYRYMPDGAVMEIATQTRRHNYAGRMVGRGGRADEWYYEFDARGRRASMLWTDKYEPDFQDRYPKRWIYDYNERGEVRQADREGQFLTGTGWETAPVTHQRRNYSFDLMGNRQNVKQGTSTAEQAGFTQGYTPNTLQQYSAVTQGRVVEITGEAAEGAVVALRIDDGAPFTVDRTLPANQTGDYNSFRYLHTVPGTAARWVKVEFTATLGPAITLRRGFVYVPPANEAPQHDLDGNLSEDGRWLYTWDAENRLIRMTQKVIATAPGVVAPTRARLEFAYDYKNRRIRKAVYAEDTADASGWRLTKDLRFVYDGWHMIAELDATFATGTGVAGITPARGVVRTYLWGPDVSGTMTGAGGVGGLLAFTFQGDIYYPISDANGNIATIHAPGIDRVIRFDYDPFGNRITNTGPDVEICPIGFSTQYTDSETGLLAYIHRYYNPQTGRFASRDPIGERGGINLYRFVNNDPVNEWDYLGWQPASALDEKKQREQQKLNQARDINRVVQAKYKELFTVSASEGGAGLRYALHWASAMAWARSNAQIVNNQLQPYSIEYGGEVCRKCCDSGYTFRTKIWKGTATGVSPFREPCPTGYEAVGSFHSHPSGDIGPSTPNNGRGNSDMNKFNQPGQYDYLSQGRANATGSNPSQFDQSNDPSSLGTTNGGPPGLPRVQDFGPDGFGPSVPFLPGPNAPNFLQKHCD